MDTPSVLALVIFVVIVFALYKSSAKKTPKLKPVVTTSERIEQLTPLLTRNEELCRTNPNMYVLQIFGVSLIGYAFIWLVVLLSLIGTILALCLVIKFPVLALKFGFVLIIGFGALVWTVIKSLWVKTEPPVGIRLERNAYPELFALIDEVRTKIKGPTIHEVVLDSKMNAAVYQIARLGFFGWNKNYLLLGLPLMQAVSPEQFRSIIGHEMGHLAEKHVGAYAWVYSAHMVWNNLLDSIENSSNTGVATALFTRFFDWYGPVFAAFTFPARREKEYGADQCAIDLVGKDLTAKALIATGVKTSFLNIKYWDNLSARARDFDVPPSTAYSELPRAIATDMSNDDARTWLTQALKEKTSFADTHPCKTDRLARILNIPKSEVAEYAHRVLEESLTIERTAAQAYLGERLREVTGVLDRQWHDEVATMWKLSHEQYQDWKKELAELEEKAANDELTPQERALLAFRTAALHDDDMALPLFEKALEAAPEDATIHDAYARCLFNKNDQRCVQHFEKAMKIDRMMEYESCQLLQAYYLKNDDEAKAKEYERKCSLFIAEYTEMQKERADVFGHDQLIPHGLPEEEIKKIVDQLGAYKGLKSVHLFQKIVHYFPDVPCYVLVVDSLKDPKLQDIDLQTILVQNMADTLALPGFTLLRSRIGQPNNLKNAVKNMPESKIYDVGKR